MSKYRDKEKEFNLSNDLINSKYILTPFAKDIMNLAITRIEETNDPDAPLSATLYNIDIFNILGTKKKSNIKRELNRVSDELMACKIIINDGKGGFDKYVIAPTCHYHGGVLKLDFNKQMRNHLLNIRTPYTTVNLVSSSMCDRFYTKRIYEILKEEYYKLNPKDLEDHVTKRVKLSELRFLIGTSNQTEEKVNAYVSKCKKEKTQIDWDYAYDELAEVKQFDRWDSFKYRILDEAKKDIEEVTEIRFEYKPIKTSHNKVKEVEFTIYPNQPEEEVMKMRRARMDAVVRGESDLYKQQDMTDVIYGALIEYYQDHSDKFGKEEIELFLQDAKGEEELVRWAIESTDKYAENNVINNYVGAVRDRIKNPQNYKNPVVVVEGSAEKGNTVTEVIENYNRNKKKTGNRVWEKLKGNEDFPDFLNYTGCNSAEELESIYDNFGEITALYHEWKIEQNSEEYI